MEFAPDPEASGRDGIWNLFHSPQTSEASGQLPLQLVNLATIKIARRILLTKNKYSKNRIILPSLISIIFL